MCHSITTSVPTLESLHIGSEGIYLHIDFLTGIVSCVELHRKGHEDIRFHYYAITYVGSKI